MDNLTRERRSYVMSRIRSRSGIERLPPSLRGFYLRPHPRIHGSPDFGNRARGIAVFIDGCFWHGCPRHYREPKSNTAFWRSKIRRNMERDGAVGRRLRAEGFTVVRLWEHDLPAPPRAAARRRVHDDRRPDAPHRKASALR